MTLNCSAEIIIDAKENSEAIYDSINIDNEFYPENPVKTKITFDKKIIISVESDHLPHLRANLNLRVELRFALK